MIPIIEKEITKYNWIKKEEFPDIIALAQSAPGLIAVNIAIFIGHKVSGTKGSIIATLGCILPPFFIILAIAMVFTDFKDNPVVEKVFKGIRPVVVSLIAIPMARMAKQSNHNWGSWALTVGTLLLVVFAGLSPIYILTAVILVSLIIAHYKKENKLDHNKVDDIVNNKVDNIIDNKEEEDQQ